MCRLHVPFFYSIMLSKGGGTMDQNSKRMINEFIKVSKKGWVKSTADGWGSIGLTFEHEIGKSPDSKYLPDFDDIELKCSSRFSRYPMYLFAIAFDSRENEIIRLANKYGFNDPDYPDKKVLFRKVDNAIVAGNKYNFFLRVDRANEKVYLDVYSNDGDLLDNSAYITFESLKKHFETKLKKIAYIKASKKVVDEVMYYRYYQMKMYNSKDFNTFLNLIDNNMLVINLVARVNKCGEDKGRYKNKSIVFAIRKDNLDKLFDCYYDYNLDNYNRDNMYRYNFRPF